MKSIKTLIISGAVTLAMALPLSGMAKGHSQQGNHNNGDRVAAKACIIQHVKSGKSSSVIQKAYCVQSNSECLSKVNVLIQKAQALNLSSEMVVAIKDKCADTVCNKVSAACKKNSCMSSDASGS